MAKRLSSLMDGATINEHHETSSDDTSISLPFKAPMGVQAYYGAICKIQPLARRNFIVEELRAVKRPYHEEKHARESVRAIVKHLRGHDISDQLKFLIIEKSPYSNSSIGSAKHIVSRGTGNEIVVRLGDSTKQLKFETSSSSNNKKLCHLEELFRLIAIISENSHLYSTDIDASSWFAATIMETAQAIFHCESDDDESGWFKRTFLSSKPQTECGRQIVVAYKADKKKNPTPTSRNTSTSQTQSIASNAAEDGKETEKA